MNNICLNCGATIPPERLEAIKTFNLNCWCFSCADKNTRPIKGIYSGETGTSQIVFTDKISMQSGIYRERFIEPDDEENTFDLTPEPE